MAKGKHAAALFEVIHSGRYPSKPLMNTPKWWFKRNNPKGHAPEPGESAATTAEADPTAASDVATTTTTTTTTASDPTSSSDSTRDRGRAHAVDVALDSQRRQITFKVSYGSAIITGFTLLVIVSLAYVVGKKMSRGPTPAVASETTEQLRAGPARPDVLNVAPSSGSQANANPSPQPRDADEGNPSRPNDDRDAHHTSERLPPGPPPQPQQPGVTASTSRLLGLNYVVVQSYPDEASAVEARDALTKSGVGCTIEQKLRGLNSSWFIVVGTQGFPRAGGAEYQAHVKKIEEVSYQLTRAKRSAKPFTPFGYKWDKAG